jgi:hypothetical protein
MFLGNGTHEHVDLITCFQQTTLRVPCFTTTSADGQVKAPSPADGHAVRHIIECRDHQGMEAFLINSLSTTAS